MAKINFNAQEAINIVNLIEKALVEMHEGRKLIESALATFEDPSMKLDGAEKGFVDALTHLKEVAINVDQSFATPLSMQIMKNVRDMADKSEELKARLKAFDDTATEAGSKI